MPLTEEERNKLEELLKKVAPEELESTRKKIQGEELPMLWWNQNIIAMKLLLRKVLVDPGISEEKLVEFLRSKNLVTSRADVHNYGYVYNETNLFVIDERTGEVTLTDIGKKIAEIMDDDEYLKPMETVIMRGLQVQGAGYTVLHLIALNRGIFRKDLVRQMRELYKGEGGNYYGDYYVGVFKDLKLIKSEIINREARYIPTFPTAWATEKKDRQKEMSGSL